MPRLIKILHISNHAGTTLNANQLGKYINTPDTPTPDTPTSTPDIKIQITTHPWSNSYYINSTQADKIFQEMQDIITPFDILLFTDTAMYGRPFLQNMDKHPCQIIFYITNRFDWGIWNIKDPAFYTLYAESSRNPRIRFTADNRYDKYYAQHKGNIYFPMDDYMRLVPHISPPIMIPIDTIPSHGNSYKFLVQNRGTDVSRYITHLDKYQIPYDIFDMNKRYRDKEHICEYLGILHLPYQVNIQSLWENLGYGIVHFIPSKAFLLQLVHSGWYYWEEYARGEPYLSQSIELSEWYCPDIADCFIFFDSWDDLYHKYSSLQTNSSKSINPIPNNDNQIPTLSTTLSHTLSLYPKWYMDKRHHIIETVKDNNKITVAKWIGLFQDLIYQRPTIITMFYDIRKMDGDQSDYHRKKDTFYSLAKQFILSLNIPLFICVDPDNTEIIEMINKTRSQNGLNSITYIHLERFEDTFFYRYMERIKEMQGKYHIYNGNPRHETPRYITLNNNKFHFIDRAIEINPYMSNKFIWLDMGINHVAQKPFEILNWQYYIPDKIRQMCINPYLEDTPPCELFHNIYHHTAGGLLTGSQEYLTLYIKLYKLKLEQILNEGWYQIDEAIMTLVQRDRPDLFDFYYGDYEGIIANYKNPDLSMNLIMSAIEKTIHFNRWDGTYKILKYLEPYFQMEANQYSGHFYKFIHYYILAGYQSQDKYLLPDIVIRLVNKKLSNVNNSGRHYMVSLLDILKDHLDKYSNKDKIITYLPE
jgi:hypothetical protein